ncbi:hypothetical protein N5U19_08310 [Aliarcobacter butzleri]|uniref:hypothetical protein n=1 Tax=Aliarcobacter butzleri TaxID=28197 RepID=UPI0021B52239|nr:hypothetical protein [Aliarcobacter butzleri]MCT7650885.1 hypothetical protein [Aliarcobacter butzleri]
MKNYLFYTQDGFTYDNSHNQTNNMQLLGNGRGKNLNEAFENFKENQSYLLCFDYENVIVIRTVSNSIMNLKLKGNK